MTQYVSLPVAKGTAGLMQCARTVWRASLRLSTSILFVSCVATAAADDSTADSFSGERAGQVEAADKTSVFYLTNRQRQEGKPAAEVYNGDRGAPHFGRCEVEFTPIPIVDEVASRMPFYVKSETKEVLLADKVESALFWEALRAAAGRTSSV